MIPQDFASTLVSALGGIAGITLIVFFVVRFIGTKFITDLFDRNFAEYKHKQDLEISRLRIEIDTLLSGNLLLQQREFETLSEAWQLLDVAFAETASVASKVLRTPKLNNASREYLEEFLNETPLSKTQKESVISAADKTAAFREINFLHGAAVARGAQIKFVNYISRYGIFFPKEIKTTMIAIAQELKEALSKKELGIEHKDSKLQIAAWDQIEKSIKPKYDDVENRIYTRLRQHGKELEGPDHP